MDKHELPAAGPGGVDLASDQGLNCERIIRRFEKAWQNGEPPAIEAFLPAERTLRNAVLLELIHVDFELRQKRGESVTAESYLRRFPELAGDLSSLAAQADSTAGPLRRRAGFKGEKAASRHGVPRVRRFSTFPASNLFANWAAGGWESFFWRGRRR